MLFRQLALAASAAAFLIVPDVSVADKDTINALPVDTNVKTFELPATAFSQSLDLPCRKCRGRDTHLKMNFAVEDGSRLTLNGFELYPNADPWHGDLTASVVKGNGHERSQTLGYSLAVKPQGFDEQQMMEVVGIELRVIEVGNRFVEAVPSVTVKLVRAADNEILIGSLNVNEPAPPRCESVWCRVMESFDRGCQRFRHGRPGPHGHPHGPKPPHHHARPGHHAHPHPHGDEEPAHRHWRLLIKGLASHIFLPVLMGITAGFGVALFVMCLCRLAIRLTALVRGEKQPALLRCPRRKRARVAENAKDEEKSALVDNQGLPPYEDDNAQN
jgi:hypothetical protein